jgi:hypothetical protein
VGSVVYSNRGINSVEFIYPRSHNEIMEMQCDLLMSNSEDQKTMALVNENIENISGRPLSYRGDSLKLGLWKAFDLQKQKQKQKQQPPAAKLRCSRSSCVWYTNCPSYSSIGSSVSCQACKNPRRGASYFECVDCGYTRTGSYASCQSCGKQFV